VSQDIDDTFRCAFDGGDLSGQTLPEYRRPGWSSPPSPLRSARSARSRSLTASPAPGFTPCWTATRPRARQRSSRGPGGRTPPRRQPARARPTSSSGCARNWLRAQPAQPATLAGLQALLDAFAVTCNTGARTAHCKVAQPGRRLRRPAQGRPRRPRRRHPQPRPHRPYRQHRPRHPQAPRAALQYRHQPPPHRNPRPAPGPGPAHPRHQRRHRRTHPRADPRPGQALPAHRQAIRLAKENIATLT
jgi:hypothetical protein